MVLLSTFNDLRHAATVAAAFFLLGCMAPAQDQEHGGVTIVLRVDGKTVSVRVDGDTIKATADGEELPKSQIEKKGRTWIVKDGDGDPVAQIVRWPGGLQFARVPRSKRATIGVELDRLPRSLADHLDLDPREVIYVTRAIEGRAAAKAGLHDHDVIVEIEDESPVNETLLQRVLAKKNPGDSIAVRVLRRGRNHDMKIRCERVKNRHLVPGGLPGLALPPVTWNTLGPIHLKSLKAANKSVAGLKKLLGKKTNPEYLEQIAKIQAALRKVQGSQQSLDYTKALNKAGLFWGENGFSVPYLKGWNVLTNPKSVDRWLSFDDLGKGAYMLDPFTTRKVSRGSSSPRTRGKASKSVNKQLRDLEQRFDRLERMIKKLVDRRTK